MLILSRFLANPTVGFLRAKKESYSRGEGNAWAPISWSFDKIRDVGDLSYFVYFRFKCFVNVSVGLRP